MKNLLIFYFLLSTIATSLAQKVNFQPSLSQTFDLAKKENKLVFIEYYNSDCHVCKSLEPVFSDSVMSSFYNKNFINFKLKTENMSPEEKQFMDNSKLKPESVPLFFFFDKNQQFIHFAQPSEEIKVLIEIAETALNENDRAANLANKYNMGERTIKTLYAYCNLAHLYKQDSLAKQIAYDLYEAFPKDNLGTKKSYIVTKNCVSSIDNGFFIYWVNHINQLTGMETGRYEGREKQQLSKILFNEINSPNSRSWDLTKIQMVKDMITKLEYSDNPEAFFWQQELGLLLEQNRNEEALQFIHRLLIHPKTDIKAAINYLNYCFTHFTDKNELIMLKKWSDETATKAVEEEDKASFKQLDMLYLAKMK